MIFFAILILVLTTILYFFVPNIFLLLTGTIISLFYAIYYYIKQREKNEKIWNMRKDMIKFIYGVEEYSKVYFSFSSRKNIYKFYILPTITFQRCFYFEQDNVMFYGICFSFLNNEFFIGKEQEFTTVEMDIELEE